MQFLKESLDTVVRNAEELKDTVFNVPESVRLVKAATNNEQCGPHGSVMRQIADMTNESSEYHNIFNTLWERLEDNNVANWRCTYKALLLLEYLIRNGSDRIINDSRQNSYQLKVLQRLQFVDEEGNDRGLSVRERAKQIDDILHDNERLREERKKAKQTKDKYNNSMSSEESYGWNRRSPNSTFSERRNSFDFDEEEEDDFNPRSNSASAQKPSPPPLPQSEEDWADFESPHSTTTTTVSNAYNLNKPAAPTSTATQLPNPFPTNTYPSIQPLFPSTPSIGAPSPVGGPSIGGPSLVGPSLVGPSLVSPSLVGPSLVSGVPTSTNTPGAASLSGGSSIVGPSLGGEVSLFGPPAKQPTQGARSDPLIGDLTSFSKSNISGSQSTTATGGTQSSKPSKDGISSGSGSNPWGSYSHLVNLSSITDNPKPSHSTKTLSATIGSGNLFGSSTTASTQGVAPYPAPVYYPTTITPGYPTTAYMTAYPPTAVGYPPGGY